MPDSPAMSGRRPAVPRAHPRSECHRCQRNSYVITGKGSVFLKCSARAEKYQPQPQIHCPVFAPLPLAWLGEALLVWAAEPLQAPVLLDVDAAGRWIGACPPTDAGGMPGNGILSTDDGARWQTTPTRAPTLGWWIAGPPPRVGAPAWLRPADDVTLTNR